MRSVPLAKEIVYGDVETERLRYLPSKVKLPDLLCNGLVVDLDQWSNESVVASTTLDLSQTEALHSALTSRVALIQGPPGELLVKSFHNLILLTNPCHHRDREDFYGLADCPGHP